MYAAICRSAMTRDAHEIVAAVDHLLALIGQFQENHADGNLDQELRRAGALGARECLPADLAEQGEHWLEDTQGLVWTLDLFRDLFDSSLYPLDQEAGARTGALVPARLKPR